jgi:hypothetical protein
MRYETMTCSKCAKGERVRTHPWCQSCLTQYQRQRRARLKLEKVEKPYDALRTASTHIVALLGMLNNRYFTIPTCCTGSHLRGGGFNCPCSCHKAREWAYKIALQHGFRVAGL